MADAKQVSAKYLYLDIVGYTHDRSVEAQTDIINCLNAIVKNVIESFSIAEKNILYIPTGDGICIALFDTEDIFDIHMQIALKLLENLDEYNKAQSDEMRKMQIRIGINENIDNLIVDINGKYNVAGAGVSMAQRIMNLADGGQILIGHTVYEMLRYREKYMKAFRPYNAHIKHGYEIKIFQFIEEGHIGLNITPPSAFAITPKPKMKLDPLAAYYFAYSLKHKDFAIQKVLDYGQVGYTWPVVLWFLSKDQSQIKGKNIFDVYDPEIFGKGEKSINEIFEHYNSIDFSVILHLCDYIIEKYLWQYSEYFENSTIARGFHFINNAGITKLKNEYPDIWEELELNSSEN